MENEKKEKNRDQTLLKLEVDQWVEDKNYTKCRDVGSCLKCFNTSFDHFILNYL